MSGFPGLPSPGGDPRQVATVVNRMNLGKLNCTGAVTLIAAQASTTVLDHRAAADSHITFMPLTANAASELAAGSMYVSVRASGSFTIAHADNAQADRRFAYLIIG